jgi:hypothetical protein
MISYHMRSQSWMYCTLVKYIGPSTRQAAMPGSTCGEQSKRGAGDQSPCAQPVVDVLHVGKVHGGVHTARRNAWQHLQGSSKRGKHQQA